MLLSELTGDAELNIDQVMVTAVLRREIGRST